MYKIAISDLDGTLLGPDHRMSTETKQSIHRWLQDNRKFVIATGRHYLEAKNVQDELGNPIYLITSNGARVHNNKGEIILKQNLPADIAQSICNIDFDSEVQINLFTDTHWYTNFELKALAEFSLGKDFQWQVSDVKTIDKSNIIKIFFWGEREKLNLVYEQLKAQFSDKINLTFSLQRCLEVMDANTNKGNAVHTVLKEHNLTTMEAIAFGDGMNDVEMLKEVGKPILMANAQQDLISSLPKVEFTKSSKEHGVAVKLDSLILEKR
jgi:Cof subfamily protein (haloacid dehalogenase superfamily)